MLTARRGLCYPGTLPRPQNMKRKRCAVQDNQRDPDIRLHDPNPALRTTCPTCSVSVSAAEARITLFHTPVGIGSDLTRRDPVAPYMASASTAYSSGKSKLKPDRKSVAAAGGMSFAASDRIGLHQVDSYSMSPFRQIRAVPVKYQFGDIDDA